MRSTDYHEGQVFAVPLRAGGYGAVVVARKGKEGKVILGYLLRASYKKAPGVAEVAHAKPADAIKGIRMGDLAIKEGTWPLAGKLNRWNRKEWPMPSFIRKDEIHRRAWKVTYSDYEPNQIVSEQPIDYDANLERESVAGSGAVEILLTQMLANSN